MKTKTLKGFVAMNKNDFDIENMSFYKNKIKAEKTWGKRQSILPITIVFGENVPIKKMTAEQKKNISEMVHHFLRHKNNWNNANFLTEEIMDIIKWNLS